MSSFEGTFNQHYIQHHLSPFLTPSEALQARLVSKDFAKALGDKVVWIEYYKERDLDASKTSQQTTGNHNLSNLARTFKIWTSIHETMNEFIEEVIRTEKHWYYTHCLKNCCITVIALSELAPLHRFAMQTLHQHYSQEELPRDELLLRVVQRDENLIVDSFAHMLAIDSQAHHAAEQRVQQALINIVGRSVCMKVALAAISALEPHLDSTQTEEVVLTALRQNDPSFLIHGLKTHLPKPKILQAVIDSHRGWRRGLANFVHDHLHLQSVVDQLLEQFNVEIDSHIIRELAYALAPVACQAPVQKALFRKLEVLPSDGFFHNARMAIINTLQSISLDGDIKNEFLNSTCDEVKQLIHQDNASKLKNYDPNKYRHELLTALLSKDSFVRKAAATALAPIAVDDQEILAAFYSCITSESCDEVAAIAISAFKKLAHQKDVRIILINRGILNSFTTTITVATIEVLQPFIDEREVQQAFLVCLNKNDCSIVRCCLINALAPKLDNPDVLSLFLMAAQNDLPWQTSDLKSECQIAAIRELIPFLDDLKVKKGLLNAFKRGTSYARTALLQSLCSDSSKPLLKTKTIFQVCIHSNVDHNVSSAALHVLKQWIAPNTSNQELV